MPNRDEMTGAELLREAARLMRERAERAGGSDPSPWKAEGSEVLYVGSVADDPIGKFDLPQWADHAASWHPAVALPVADWLEAEANGAEADAADSIYGPGVADFILGNGNEPGAIAVARAYLAAPVSAGEPKEDAHG